MKTSIKNLIFAFALVAIFAFGAGHALAAGPSALTSAASSTSSSITFNGAFMANGAQTTTMFEYSTNLSDLPNGMPGSGIIDCQILQPVLPGSGSITCTLNTPTILVNTTYYVRAVASNVNGTSYGNATSIVAVAPVPPPSTAPSALTTEASATATSITFHGAFMWGGVQTTTMFEYSTNLSYLPSGQPGNGIIACQTTQPALRESGSLSCTLNTPTIAPDTTYYVRTVASNINGTDYGNATPIETNSTPPPPSPNTPTLTSVNPNSGTQGQTLTVTLNGTNFTTGATTTFGSGITVNSVNFINSNQITANITISTTAPIGGHNVTVTTVNGTSNAQTFTVLSANPLAPTLTSISPTSRNRGQTFTMTLNGTNFTSGSVINFSPATNITVNSVNFINSTQLTADITISSTASTGSRDVSVTTINGTSNTRPFNVTHTSSGGGGGGGGSDPSVNTISYTVNGTSVTLFGSVDPNNHSTTAWFEYGTSISNLNNETTHLSMGSGNSSVSFNRNINVALNTTYYFRAVAENSSGDDTGEILSFTTGITPVNNTGLGATTVTATNKTSTTARLNGIAVIPSGSVNAYFEYGTSVSLGHTTSAQSLSSAYSVKAYGDTITGLTPNTIYYFRAVVSSGSDVAHGSILVFQTLKGGNIPSGNVEETAPAPTPDVVSEILTISADKDEIMQGDTVEYLVSYKNTSTKNFENTVLTVQLPSEITFDEANFGTIDGDNTLTFKSDTLIPDQIGSITVKGHVNGKANPGGILITTATMIYNLPGSTVEQDEIAYTVNHVIEGENLAAASIFGSGKFLPTTLIGWLALILVLMGIVTIGKRMLTGYSFGRNRNGNTPMNM